MTSSRQTAQTSSSGRLMDGGLGLLSGLFFAVGLYMAFYYAPLLKHNGLNWWSQKIFYLHLPAAWGSMIGLVLVLVGSVAYFVTRKESWDSYAVAAAEPCLLFATFVMLTGPLWGRPSWNTYWKWDDPRLMSYFALWLLLIAYFMLRSFSEDGELKRSTSAALGILGAISVPFVYLSVRMGNTLHPRPNKMQIGGKVWITTYVFLGAFVFLFWLIFRVRRRLEEQRNQATRVQRLLLEME
ncbi:MAG: hypothetical protein EP343_30280 [Deltaproteobacteria bacterium]|nr:MAG: hypothetical protein EP343_30280 [Deltaproteobacteria bacterium]